MTHPTQPSQENMERARDFLSDLMGIEYTPEDLATLAKDLDEAEARGALTRDALWFKALIGAGVSGIQLARLNTQVVRSAKEASRE